MAEYPALPLWTDAYLADTDHLGFEEHGAYLRLMMLAWRTPGCSLIEDPAWIARRLRITLEDYARVIAPIVSEFWEARNGRLYQKRLSREFAYVRAKSKKQSARAKSRWDKEKDACRGNATRGNAPTPTPTIETQSLVPPSELTVENPESDGKGGVGGKSAPSRTSPSPQAAPARPWSKFSNGHAKPTQGTRLDPEWTPGPDGTAYAMTELGNDATLVNETWTSFKDYWLAKAGSSARKANWPLTWKTWVRRTRDELRERHARQERYRNGRPSP
jgi:uncharacterized protein YdaU (DUF1376 family)